MLPDGGNLAPAAEMAAQLRPVLAWKTRILGIREISAGDTVGYGATWTAKSPRRIALLPVGYADGYSRRMSRANVTESDTNTGGDVLVRSLGVVSLNPLRNVVSETLKTEAH